MSVVLGLFVVLNTGVLVRRGVANRAQRRVPEPVVVVDRTLARALPLLPQRGLVGYLQPDFVRASPTDLAGFYQAQFALAPRVLVVGGLHDTVIGAARFGGPLPSAPPGFVWEQTFSDRWSLLRRAAN